MLRRSAIIIAVLFFFFYNSVCVFASKNEVICTSKSYAVFEAGTNTLLASSADKEIRSISHLTKLMTILLCAESIENKSISLDDIVVVTPTANSMQGTQIWLEVGEKITIEELLYSVTVGNANDAAVALAEKLGKTHEGFVELMNSRAVKLGMLDTHFVDASGIDEGNVSTAYDLGLLCCEIAKYDFLRQYFTTWMINVRYGKTELVNTNRLVRSYNGISGMKACYSDSAGQCIAVSAKRGDMYLVGVFLDSSDADSRFSDAKSVLDDCFSKYMIYTPEISEEFLLDVNVSGGTTQSVKVKLDKLPVAVILRGDSKNIEVVCERQNTINAPFEENTVVGSVELILSDEVISSADIITTSSCIKNNLIFSLKRLLCSLLIY